MKLIKYNWMNAASKIVGKIRDEAKSSSQPVSPGNQSMARNVFAENVCEDAYTINLFQYVDGY